jgi:hypothetical protein
MTVELKIEIHPMASSSDEELGEYIEAARAEIMQRIGDAIATIANREQWPVSPRPPEPLM